MLNYYRRLRRDLIENGNLKRYLIYAIGEILLVMLGILLALKVNNLNTVSIEKNDEFQFYQNFKRQIGEDQRLIKGSINYNNIYKYQYDYAVQIIEDNDKSKMDTLGFIAINLTNYSDFDRPSNIYESIVNSGEIALISNKKIIEKIQLLEESYTHFNRMEDIHYDLIIKSVPDLFSSIKFYNRSVQQPAKLYSFEFQNILITIQKIIQEKDDVYNKAINQIDEITEMIDEELN